METRLTNEEMFDMFYILSVKFLYGEVNIRLEKYREKRQSHKRIFGKLVINLKECL